MKHYFSTSSLLFLLFISINILSSCRDQNYDWNAAKKDQRVEQYEESFKSIFGDIDPQQSWDFSTCGNESVTRAAVEESVISYDLGSLTRSGESSSSVSIPENVISEPASAGNAACKNYPDNSINNKSNCVTDYHLYSTGDFLICPIWHGKCKVYNLIIESVDKTTGATIERYELDQKSINTAMNYGTAEFSTESLGTSGTRNGPLGYLLHFTKGLEIKLYLESLDGKTKGSSILSTLTGNNIYKNNQPYTNMICLDDQENDQDFNDLIVLTAKSSSEAPAPKITTITSSTKKRYMVEDLGTTSTSDIDFNDIVVDLAQFKEDVYEEGVKKSSQTSLTATIRALGGTLDFDLCLGDTKIFTKSNAASTINGFSWALNLSPLQTEKMYNTGGVSSMPDPFQYDGTTSLASKSFIAISEVSGTTAELWNPANNNIMITVKGKSSSTASIEDKYNEGITSNYDIKFPNKGEVPAIIAFDVNKAWRLERDGITVKECESETTYYWFTSTDPRK